MFFMRNKETNKPVPQTEIDKLIADGLSDRDIIKKLKSKGFSYGNIETAMMRAVKSGVDDKEERPVPRIAQQPSQNIPEPAAPMPEPDPFMNVSDADIDDLSPEQIVEELVEGVVESKWKKFDEKIEKLNAEVNSLRDATRNVKPRENPGDSKEYEEKMNMISSQVDDLSARVGGLEKAFKQFLPSLTNNIQSLSNIIHTMKKQQRV
jgi:DNA-binding transcriptional MerR regulator